MKFPHVFGAYAGTSSGARSAVMLLIGRKSNVVWGLCGLGQSTARYSRRQKDGVKSKRITVRKRALFLLYLALNLITLESSLRFQASEKNDRDVTTLRVIFVTDSKDISQVDVNTTAT